MVFCFWSYIVVSMDLRLEAKNNDSFHYYPPLTEVAGSCRTEVDKNYTYKG